MKSHKLQVKIFADAGSGITPESLVPVFHRWIKQRVLSELMIDVANYAHVPKGPGVVLIGHGADYFMDESDGRLGLLYSRKRLPPSPDQPLADAFRRALHAAMLLEQEATLAGKLRFSSTEFLFRINDRLGAPNDDLTFAAVKAELDALAEKLFAAPFELKRAGDEKSLLGVTMTSPARADLNTLLGRLGGPVA